MKNKRKWNKYPETTPPNVNSVADEIDYEIKCLFPDGKVRIITTEWSYEKSFNCRYPVLAWREENKIIQFPG